MTPQTKERHKEYMRGYSKTHKEQHNESVRKYRESHSEQCKETYKKYYQDHKEQRRQDSRNSFGKLRKKVLEKYGGKCIRCGFSDNRALQIDHIHGNGRREVEELHSRWKFLRKVLVDTKGNYQLLCANCNVIKKDEQGETRK